MATTTTTRVAVIDEPPHAVSVEEMTKSLRFLDRTGLFFKRVSQFRTARRKSQEDRKASTGAGAGVAVFPRKARSMDIANKAFSMSQPVLGVASEHSMTDNDEASDSNATTAAGSPTPRKPKRSAPPAPPVPPKSATPRMKATMTTITHAPSNVDVTPRIPAPSSQAAVSRGAAPTQQTEGLPAEDAPSWVWVESNTAKSPNANIGPAASSTNPAAVTSAAPVVEMADCGSHESEETFHSAPESLVSSPVPQQSDIPLVGSPEGSPNQKSTPLIDHPLPSPPPSSGRVKFTSPTQNPRNPFLSLIANASANSPTRASTVPTGATVPSRTPNLNLLSPGTTPNVTPGPSTLDASLAAVSPSTYCVLPPRLASLPPPLMAQYASEGSVRLSTPTITPRPTPMPILNLPMLPLPTPQIPPEPGATQSPARLRSMPVLAMSGYGNEADDADHENAGLDEMEMMDELDEMEDEDADAEADGEAASAERTSSSSGSPEIEMEVPTVGHRLRSPLPPSLSRTPGGGSSPGILPRIDTTPLGITFRKSPDARVDVERPNTQYFTPTDPLPPDVLRTPIPAFRKAGTSSVGAGEPVVTDYFNAKAPERTTGSPNLIDLSRTPRPDDRPAPVSAVVPRTMPMPSASPRPGLYQQGSRSMIDLLSMGMSRKGAEDAGVDGAVDSKGLERRASRKLDTLVSTYLEQGVQPAAGPSTHPHAHSDEQVPKTPTLRRQRSLPMYTTATDPPPYPMFSLYNPRPLPIMPREEEGREQLPGYTNSIYLVAVMPRKMEFSAPGFQAKDRKWKRALCVLEGTVLKVYRVHGSVVEDWWERTVGVGDRTTVDPMAVGAAGTIRVSGLRGTENARGRGRAGSVNGDAPKKGDASPNQADIEAGLGSSSRTGAMPACQIRPPPPSSSSRLKLQSLLHPRHKAGESVGSSGSIRTRMSLDDASGGRGSASSTPRRQSVDSSAPTSPTRAVQRHNSSDTSPSPTPSPSMNIGSAASRTSTPTPATSHFGSTTSCCFLNEEPDSKDLVRAYTLQHAESGLASDYTKRRNVIRVRMEGEQFLLQAKDVPGVIEWIEGIQAATNIALDLDERPMPKGPMFPRRRRRRARRPADTTTAASAVAGTTAAATSSSSRA